VSRFTKQVMCAALLVAVTAGVAQAQIKTATGAVKGKPVDGGITVYFGVPYAAPPVGDLRWKAPQAPQKWEGVRDASQTPAACMQPKVFDDINFAKVSEDCLTLNVWVPGKAKKAPVMVWIHGGGFAAGGGDEPRHNGEAFAKKGVVLVTINYRLGIFGFFAHPDLTKESPAHASGNYGLLDQIAALKWVKGNIAAFGGDPSNVTIFGESAGSFSVSALVATPLAKGLFHKAIGESGAFFTLTERSMPLAAAEQQGATFATTMQADSLASLRGKTAQEVMDAAGKAKVQFWPIVDGYVFPKPVPAIYAAGEQNHVPLLAGWNADEIRMAVTLNPNKPTVQSVTENAKKQFGDHADAIVKAYGATSDADALEAAAALGSDSFIGYGTWKWIETHLATGKSPVYRYSFDRKIPVPEGNSVMGRPATSADIGARHAGEIEYVFGSLALSLPKTPWTDEDRKLSDTMTSYWANFARTGDPSGPGLATWPKYTADSRRVMHLDVTVKDAPEANRARYEALDAYVKDQPAAAAPPSSSR
jgi:para-nitrobenzyl esterase